MQTQDGKVIWATHRIYYCKAEITNLEKNLTADGKRLLQYGNGRRSYLSSFHPEIYKCADLDGNSVHKYQHQISVLCWAIELSTIDIMTEVSCLLQHVCAPWVNHLAAVYKLYHYTRKNMKHKQGRLVFDPTLQEIYD